VASLGKTRLFYRPIFDPKLCEEANFRRGADAAFHQGSENLAQSGMAAPEGGVAPGKTGRSWRVGGTPSANCDPAFLADRTSAEGRTECPVVRKTPIPLSVRSGGKKWRTQCLRDQASAQTGC
jgi:hypothetical protein